METFRIIQPHKIIKYFVQMVKWNKTQLIVIQFLSAFGLQWALSCSRDLISIQRYQVTVNNDEYFDWSQEITLFVHKVSQTQIEQFVWHEFFIQHLLFKPKVLTSFGILIKLKLTFFGKGRKVPRTLTNPFYNLNISIWVKILNQILNLMSY